MRPLAAVALLAGIAAPAGAAVAVVHQAVPDQLDSDRLRDVMLGRSTTWSDGSPVVLVIAADQQAVAAVSGRDPVRLLRGWKRLVFAGSASMPELVPDAEAALRLVAVRRGAITILDAEPQREGVRTVALAAGGSP